MNVSENSRVVLLSDDHSFTFTFTLRAFDRHVYPKRLTKSTFVEGETAIYRWWYINSSHRPWRITSESLLTVIWIESYIHRFFSRSRFVFCHLFIFPAINNMYKKERNVCFIGHLEIDQTFVSKCLDLIIVGVRVQLLAGSKVPSQKCSKHPSGCTVSQCFVYSAHCLSFSIEPVCLFVPCTDNNTDSSRVGVRRVAIDVTARQA